MRTVKALLIGGLATASLIVAVVGPATAADTKGTLAIVNGIPGKKVDVCLDGKEIKSGLKYGGAVLRNVVATGDKDLKFFRPDPRTCRGTLIAKRKFPLAPAEDLTIVVTRDAPRVVTFDNAGLGEIPPLGAPVGIAFIAWRHAAEVAVNLKYRTWTPNPETPVAPAVDPVWSKGAEDLFGAAADWIWQLRATLPESSDSIAGPTRVLVSASRRYEWIFVGTHPNNTRFVLLDRAVSAAAP